METDACGICNGKNSTATFVSNSSTGIVNFGMYIKITSVFIARKWMDSDGWVGYTSHQDTNNLLKTLMSSLGDKNDHNPQDRPRGQLAACSLLPYSVLLMLLDGFTTSSVHVAQLHSITRSVKGC